MPNYSNRWKILDNCKIQLSLTLNRVPPTSVEAEPPLPEILGVVRPRRDYRPKAAPILFEHWRMEKTVKCPRSSGGLR